MTHVGILVKFLNESRAIFANYIYIVVVIFARRFMKDFLNWCNNHKLINVHEDGSVLWADAVKEQTQEPSKSIEGGKNVKHSEKLGGGRDGCDDLSSDYKGHMEKMGTVWPFKVLKGNANMKATS